MGNCWRSRRRHELLLHSCDGDDGNIFIVVNFTLILPRQLRLITLILYLHIFSVVTLGQGEPLVRQTLVWTADVPLTMGQLQGRRDTFWDTAPMYDGRREIWDALRAAVEAAEKGEFDLADAILSGASITLPAGIAKLTFIHSFMFTQVQKKKGNSAYPTLRPLYSRDTVATHTHTHRLSQ